MKIHNLFVIILIICSCKQKPKITALAKDAIVINDRKGTLPKIILPEWTSASDYYGVYRFAANVTGIGFEIGNNVKSGNTIDSLFGIALQNSSQRNIVDSTSSFNIEYSKDLENIIKTNDSTRDFYIYGTKGVTKAIIKKVLYISTDCSGFLILQLSDIDTLKYGTPLIASKIKLNLNYKNDQVLQKKIEKLTKTERAESDYKDSIEPKQFAYNKNICLTYSDDLQWFLKSDNPKRSLFPDRRIFKIDKNKFEPLWAMDLDLFGIPCD